ncbi:MAG: hypothetical protein OEU26_27740, partial [Candidatus Tectomicrobia bacterium]|nr:hypothetical protein [Candidatus Tectomicrobia bacterium]
YQLDQLDDRDDEAMEAFAEEIIELFSASPEGQAHRKVAPGMGFWAGQLIDYGYIYCGVTLPEMAVPDVVELLSDIFPRKITLSSPDDADAAIPELIAFWAYLEREYQLPEAKPILRYLRDLPPDEFKSWMMDPSRFGMAKSFMMGGRAAGFDMTDPAGQTAFATLYNASKLAYEGDIVGLLQSTDQPAGRSKKASLKTKRTRKLVKASRKKNRKRK